MAYVLMIVIVGAIIGGLVFWSKKTNQKMQGYIDSMTPEQLDYLKNADATPCAEYKNSLLTKAMLMNVKEGTGNKRSADAIYYNFSTQRHEIAETTIPAERIEAGVKVGDYVDIILKMSKEGYIEGTHGLK